VKRRGGGREWVEYVDFCGCLQCMRRAEDRVAQDAWGEDKTDNLRAKGSEDIRWKAMLAYLR
jgi:hypothetical protein